MTTEAAASIAGQPAAASGDTTAAMPDTVTQTPTADTGAAAVVDQATTETAAVTGAPEAYAWTAPEGLTYDPGTLEAFSGVARELNLPQDKAQLVIDKMAPVLAARQAEQVKAMTEGWAAEARADKEFGGDKLTESLAAGERALAAFGTPALREMLTKTGLANNPEVIRFMVKAGAAISEDKFVGGKTAPARGDDAKAMYPNSNMK